MDFGHRNTRMNVKDDRLSNLPDDVIHKILSFIGIKQAIETSALSSRWRYVWTSTPYLNFSSKDFHTLAEFSKFVTHVLSARNKQTEVQSVKLTFRGKARQVFVKRILEYAFNHNVQQLNIACLPGNRVEFPLSLFNSQSLKHLTLNAHGFNHWIMTSPPWELPSLATLDLHCFTLYDDNNDKCDGLFSKCANLKNLSLRNCKMRGGLKDFKICHPGLSTLTLENGSNDVNVVTPKLKNLNIKYWRYKVLVSAPNVSSFHYEDNYDPMDLSADFLHLETVDICITAISQHKEKAQKFFCLLQQIHSVRYLTLNMEIIKTLNSSVELILQQPSPFANLKGLKIYPHYVSPKAKAEEKEVTMSTEVKNYLLDSSSDATITMVSHDEIRAGRNVKSAQKLMRGLQLLIDLWKINSETKAHIEQDKPAIETITTTMQEQVEVENHTEQLGTKMKCRFGERMSHINSYWEDPNKQLDKGHKKTDRIISMLQKIEGVLTKLPTSDQEKLEERYFGLCAEAETVMENVMDCMKNQCGKKPSRSNVYFD